MAGPGDSVGEQEFLTGAPARHGVRVRYDVYDSLETLEGKLSAGRSGYDVIVPSSEPTFARLARAGALKPLDRGRIPNWGNLDPALMARVAERVGVDIRLGQPVERIAFAGRRAIGVEAGGRHHAADSVVVNADFAHAIPRLIPDSIRRRWTDRRIAKARYSCSTFMLYLGVEGEFPGLPHHTILLAEDYRRNIRQIETGEIPDVPSLYVQHAGATDPSMAPPGHTSLYLLVPVPNLLHGADWSAEAPRYRRLALDRIKGLGITDIESRIRYERMVTPHDWREEFAVGHGATFNLSHDLGQMLCFRPGNRFAELDGVYLVGGGTHPGSGLPVIYEGARITSGLLARDLGLRPVPAGTGFSQDMTPAYGATS